MAGWLAMLIGRYAHAIGADTDKFPHSRQRSTDEVLLVIFPKVRDEFIIGARGQWDRLLEHEDPADEDQAEQCGSELLRR